MAAPEIEIVINNVLSTFSLPFQIDLEKCLITLPNTNYKKGCANALMMKYVDPKCTVQISRNGKVVIIGCKGEEESLIVAESIGLQLKTIMKQQGDIDNFRISCVNGNTKFPFGILLDKLANAHTKEAVYEPELRLGLVWKMKDPQATILISAAGLINVRGTKSEKEVFDAVCKIYPLVEAFQCDLKDIARVQRKRRQPVPLINNNINNFNGVKREKLYDELGEDGLDVIQKVLEEVNNVSIHDGMKSTCDGLDDTDKLLWETLHNRVDVKDEPGMATNFFDF